MKKRTVAFLAILLVLTGALTACGFFRFGGADGNYPYDVAVSDGYTESEGSWLAENTPVSVYRRMWQEAVGDGSFSGTYFEFLRSLGLGDDSAYLQRSLLSVVSIVAHMNSNNASAGSGVILFVNKSTGDMDVLTNHHVVYNSASKKICTDLELYLYGGEISSRRLTATYMGGSATEDIALLHVNGSDKVFSASETHTNAEVVTESAAMAAEIGDSDSLLVGDKVYAVGNPEAWGISVTEGVVSVDAEYVSMDAEDGSGKVDMLEIRTDAAVNHGNSGGGLFNAAGELVGVVNARSELEGVEGFGYAIPISHAIAAAENLKANGGVLKRARLGITVETTESRSVYDPDSGRTFLSEKLVVRSAESGGAALRGGMDVGDTLISLTLNGATMQATRRFKISELMLKIRKGDTLTVVVSRGGETKTLSIVFDSDDFFETGK